MSDDELQSFTHVAPWYEALMIGVPYEQWVRYLEELLEDYHYAPRTVLDLACGTGRVSRLLVKKGYDVAGVDGSAAMIEEAKRQTQQGTVDYFCQRMEELDLPRRFDLVVSLFDSLNYLIEPKDLQKAVERVFAHLEPNGLFIFDMNGEYAFEADLFSQESYGRNRPVEYTWKSHYDPQTHLCRVEMQFYAQRNGQREEFQEVHLQRAYTVNEVNRMLERAGFELLAAYDAYTTRPVRAKSDRIFWVARKPAE